MVPGAQGAICDTVLRGKHLDVLQRHTGWLIINPVTAEHVDPKTGERTEKGHHLRTETFTFDTQQVDIWYIGGRLHRLDYTDDGVEIPVPLERGASTVRKNSNGTFRTYVEYTVPNPRGGEPHKIMERTFNTVDDTFNRAENILWGVKTPIRVVTSTFVSR